MKNPTHREIAKAAGVNPSTVSRALANHYRIPAATRRRVRAVAERLGWRPNPLASAYMAHVRSTRPTAYQATLAFVIPFAERDQFVDYHQLAFRGAKQRAADLGYTLEQVWLSDLDFSPARLSRLLKQRGIPGLLLNGELLPENLFESFDWPSFAGVSWGYAIKRPRLHRAAFHYTHGLWLATRELRRLGYRRVAMMISENHDRMAEHSWLSFFYYQARHHRPGEWFKTYELPRWHPNAAERQRARRWLERNRPEVVIGEQASWELLREMKWRVPGDVAFVSPFWSAVWPDIGGVDQCPEVIGANALDLLSAQLLRNERGVPATPKLLLNEGRWVDGASVPPLMSLK